MPLIKAFKQAALKTKLLVAGGAVFVCVALFVVIYGSLNYFEQMRENTLNQALDAIHQRNYPLASLLLTQASEAGDLHALEYLAWLESCRGNYTKAANAAAEAAQKGSRNVLEIMGDLALLGYGRITGAVAAVSYFNQSVAGIRSYDERNRILSAMIERALPLARKRQDYLDLVLSGMDYNSPSCYLRLGDILFLGDGLDVNPVEAVGMWQLALDHGFNEAATRLAGAYWHGYAVEQDQKRALQLYQQAAAGGDPVAYYALALIALRDPRAQQLGSPERQNALALLRKASALNYSPADVALGVFSLSADPYWHGMERALFWFENAWQHGDSSGAILYALMQAAGRGVKPNRDGALVILYDESALGSETAAKVLEALSKKQDPNLILHQAVCLADRILQGQIEVSVGAAEASVYHDGKEHANVFYHSKEKSSLIDPKIYQIDGHYLIVPSIGGVVVQSQPSTGARLFDFTGQKPTPLPPPKPSHYQGEQVSYTEPFA